LPFNIVLVVVDALRRDSLGIFNSGTASLGTFLRAFTFGHVRQLDALLGWALERA
jgi:hypothetical protein